MVVDRSFIPPLPFMPPEAKHIQITLQSHLPFCWVLREYPDIKVAMGETSIPNLLLSAELALVRVVAVWKEGQLSQPQAENQRNCFKVEKCGRLKSYYLRADSASAS